MPYNDDTLLDERQTAHEFFHDKIPVRTLQYLRAQGRGPVYVKLGRHVLYRPADLQAWIDAAVVEPQPRPLIRKRRGR